MYSRSVFRSFCALAFASLTWIGTIGTVSASPVYLESASIIYRLGGLAYTGTGPQQGPGVNDDTFAAGSAGTFAGDDLGAGFESSFTANTAELFTDDSAIFQLTATANASATLAPGQYSGSPYAYAFAQSWFSNIIFRVEQDAMYAGPLALSGSNGVFEAGDILIPGIYRHSETFALDALLPSVFTGFLAPGQSASVSRTSILEFGFTTVPVPTPQTALLFTGGFALLLMARARRRNRAGLQPSS